MSKPEPVFPVAGVGASAGGVEALEAFFKGMPDDPGVAIVVVTHLSPERESLLHEIIARYTSLSVEVAADGAKVARNCVYVLAAGATLGIHQGRLSVQRIRPERRERKPIDIFFSALARDQGECAVGVILSGSDSDGALGVKAIKEQGGLTLAQVGDESGPSHSEMPVSAISTGFVDFAVPADEMGGKLAEFARSLQTLGVAADQSDPKEADAAVEAACEEISAIVRSQLGHDFSGYKPKTFLRRIQRRMLVLQLDTLQAYVEHLRQDPAEVSTLFRNLLINVTSFFRDADAFQMLADTVIPKLFEGRGADETVRVWSPGCSTGEEVYSIAMLMREHMDTLRAVPRVQIFATDIDERSLSIARAGRYPDALLDSVSPERRRRFFLEDGGTNVLSKEVRDLCIFSPQSVIRDPPFSRIDLVSCRNLLIYFGPDVQNQVIPIFHYALRPGGYLFLGMAENVSQFKELFRPMDAKHRIFVRREGPSSRLNLPSAMGALRASPPSERPKGGALGMLALRQLAGDQVLERHAPAHVVINRDGDVVFYSARTGKYLEAPAGAPSRQLVTLVRKGLRLDLRPMLREVMQSGQAVVREGLTVETDEGHFQTVAITVEPVAEQRDGEPLFLVLFDDQGPLLEDAEAVLHQGDKADEESAHLERELRETRERLQALIEEYETALEELKSSNEELLSVNEELQSSNEELQASKEELQSVNEELQTVNGELTSKIEALDQANSDLHNLFEITQVATVFLDRDLVIRSFTPAMTRIFNILPGDLGRPITDLSSRLALPALAQDIQDVFRRGEPVERKIDQGEEKANYLVRLAPYRTTDQLTEGVVVSFVDVTGLTRAQAHQKTLIAELNHGVKNMLMVVIGVAERTFATTDSTRAFREAFLGRVQAMARSYELLSRENWTEASMQELLRQELEPFGMDRVEMHGPAVRLKPKQALSLGMVLHELATNAGKYGAFSAPGGRLSISWSLDTADDGMQLTTTWRELDGPASPKAATTGFGLKLIDRETSHSLHGKASIEFAETGLVARIVFPLLAEQDQA